MTTKIQPSPIKMLSQPKRSYGFQQGTSDPMASNLKALENWQNEQVALNNSMGGGSSTDGYTKVEVPQTDVFNPAGPDGPNSASQGVNLNNLTAQNQTVNDTSIDNCSDNTFVLYNFTMVDEASQVKLGGVPVNTTGRIDLQLMSLDRGTTLVDFSTLFNETNPFYVCINESFAADETFVVDVQVGLLCTISLKCEKQIMLCSASRKITHVQFSK